MVPIFPNFNILVPLVLINKANLFRSERWRRLAAVLDQGTVHPFGEETQEGEELQEHQTRTKRLTTRALQHCSCVFHFVYNSSANLRLSGCWETTCDADNFKRGDDSWVVLFFKFFSTRYLVL